MTPILSIEANVLHIALGEGALTAVQVEQAKTWLQADAVREADALAGYVREHHGIDGRRFTRWLAQACGLEVVELERKSPSLETVALIPRDRAEALGVLPLELKDGQLQVALRDLPAMNSCDLLAFELGMSCEPFLTMPGDFLASLARFYDEPVLNPAESFAVDASISADDAPIIAWVHQVIQEGMMRRASDIHLEPRARDFRVRYRIDGVLMEGPSTAKSMQAAIVSRVKIMANMSIAEKRLPQDGRVQVKLAGKSVDLRVCSLVTTQGESLVMRVLERDTVNRTLTDLGLNHADRARLERLIALPDGLVLVTGPTGSGKTTTLYGCLQALNDTNRKIITVEEPVEYQICGINQVAVRSEIGMTFSSALRAMMRQSPNVIMVGEIRDLETAEIAIHAALTGHLVFSTLHTNDAAGAVTRLIDLGVKPFLVVSAVRGVVAQRLVRRNCPRCVRRVKATRAELLCLNRAGQDHLQLEKGAGCAACHGTGFLGRTGLFEFLELDDNIQSLVQNGMNGSNIRAEAKKQGMTSLREDGLRKVLAGKTTIEEVLAHTVEDTS